MVLFQLYQNDLFCIGFYVRYQEREYEIGSIESVPLVAKKGAEDVVSQALSDAMDRKLYYKRCFQYSREQLKIYLFNQSEFIGCQMN